MSMDFLRCTFAIYVTILTGTARYSWGHPRFDYLLISHFLLNLQDISPGSSREAGPSRSLVESDQRQLSSIRFARFIDSVLGNIGEPLRNGSLGDYDETEDELDITDDAAANGVSHDKEETPVNSGSVVLHVDQVNVAGPSRYLEFNEVR